MPRSKLPHLPLCLTLTLVTLAPAPAAANLRAPLTRPRAPSSALEPPAEPLTVLREGLSFACRADRCKVRAVYHLRAARQLQPELTFICPDKSTLRVLVDGREVVGRVASAPLEGEGAARLRRATGLAAEASLHRARFTAPLPAGRSRLEVRYVQELSGMEQDYGYFKDGRMVHTLRYELWPLKEWRRAPDFRLDLEVKLRRPAPGVWARAFGSYLDMRCRGQGARTALGAKPKQRGAYLVLRTRLGSDFPDRLICDLGDDDLVR